MPRSCGCYAHDGFRLRSPEGLLAQRELELPGSSEVGLTRVALSGRLDIPGSVSALERMDSHWDDEMIDEQYRRFLDAR